MLGVPSVTGTYHLNGKPSRHQWFKISPHNGPSLRLPFVGGPIDSPLLTCSLDLSLNCGGRQPAHLPDYAGYASDYRNG